jgi:hypothetical protein
MTAHSGEPLRGVVHICEKGIQDLGHAFLAAWWGNAIDKSEDALVCVCHGVRRPGPGEHRNVIGHISERNDIARRDAQPRATASQCAGLGHAAGTGFNQSWHGPRRIGNVADRGDRVIKEFVMGERRVTNEEFDGRNVPDLG